MKNIVFIFCFLISGALYANSGIVGRWRINGLMGFGYKYQYLLVKQPPDYGNNVEFRSDGTFISDYLQSGSDCSTTTSGHYKIEGEHYIYA